MPSQRLVAGAETDPPLERAERHVRELVTEQSALRKVATLVAREPTPDQLFAAVAEQVARVFAVPHVRLVRYEPEGSVVVGGFSEDDDEPFPIGSRWPLDSPGVTATVRRTGRPARVEDYAPMTGEIAAVARGAGMRSAVASPIVVGSRLWGAMVVLSPRQEPFPEDTESRLTDFTELVATAIANAESRAALARLADEQAALRRVATIAARESSPVEVFGAVAEEAARVSETDAVGILRFGPDGTATLVAQSETPWDPPPLGTSFTLEGENVVAAVHRTGEAARMDDWSNATGSVAAMAHVLGVRSAVATPIVVEGTSLGRADRRHEPDRASARGNGVADRRVHRAGRDRDRERRVARGARTTRGRAGSPPSRRRAGGTGRTARRPLCCRHRRARKPLPPGSRWDGRRRRRQVRLGP